MDIKNFQNPWAESGEYSKNNALKNNVLEGYFIKRNADLGTVDNSKKIQEINLSTLQTAQLTATVMAESNRGDYDQREIVWVYINLIRNNGFDSGLNKSSAFKQKNDWFKAYMVELGYGENYRNNKISKSTEKWMKVKDGNIIRTAYNIGEYVEKNEYFRTQGREKLLLMNNFVLNALKNQKNNPIPGFSGQGYYQYLNNVNKMGEYWHKVRQYYILWKEGKVYGTYMRVLGHGVNATFIFDLDKILKYFEDNPSKLPQDLNKIPKLYGTEILY